MINKNQYHIIGVMSGTSLDGVDLVYARFLFNGFWQFEIIHAETQPYPENWYSILKGLVSCSDEDLQVIDNKYTTYLARLINDFISKYCMHKIDAVCSHGHTALHRPKDKITYQIGNKPMLATLIGKKVVCDFRVQDVALGGQGAPLVPVGDALLFSSYDYCLNLGGFANISTIINNKSVAYDICPFNIVLNKFAQKLGFPFDDAGHLAASGKSIPALAKLLNELDFYSMLPPKSLGLEWVNEKVFPIFESIKTSPENSLKTFSDHVALQISKTIPGKSKVLVTGGGAYNEYIVSQIKALSESEITIPNKDIVDFKEALIFAFLGVLKLRNEVNCLKSVTGASKDHSSGKIFLS